MTPSSTRREFIRDLGIGAAALPFILNLPSLGFANQQQRKQRLVVLFSPNGVVPSAFWPDSEGKLTSLKESLKPLEPFKERTLILHGVCDKVRGDGDNHMRGIGCLLTGVELFPGNIQGGSDTPAGWASGISIDQEIKNYLQASPATRTRFGSLEFGVMVPDRADTWTRMVYAGPNKPIAPIDDPYQMFAKLYGRVKDQESLQQHPRRPQGRSAQGRRKGQCRGPQAAGRARHLRPRDGAGAEGEQPGGRPCGAEAGPGREEGQRQHAAHQQDADRPDGQQLRRRFRPGGDPAIHQLGRRRPDALAEGRGRPSRAVAQAGQRQGRPGQADPDQPLVLRAAGLPGQTPGRNPRTGRRRQPAGQHAAGLDQRARQGQLRTRSTTSPSCWSATAWISRWADRSSTARSPTTGCCCRWPTPWDIGSSSFGNPNFCSDGVLPNLGV